MVIDGFLDDYESLRSLADAAKFCDLRSPQDGVIYPNINLDIAEEAKKEVTDKLCRLFNSGVNIRTIFSRLSLAGVKAPHQAHTDAAMGQYSLMLYLNRPEHCAGGTAIVRHIETGAEKNPTTTEQEEIWKRDTNEYSAWEAVFMCDMKPNRAFIFPADLYHRAEPVSGFGTDATDGRLVLTAFFDLENA